MSEHDFEPIRGLPGDLPAGEEILWQGAPGFWALAQGSFHIRAVAAYFAVMLASRTWSSVASGAALGGALTTALSVTPMALLGLGLLASLAWLNSRTTVYTITNKRVVLRFGSAISKAINIPFGIIEAAALKDLPKGRGDLALVLKAPNHIPFLQLWPHVRPWRMKQPEPTLRCLPDGRKVAALLATAMQKEVSITLTLQPQREADGAGVIGRPEAAIA